MNSFIFKEWICIFNEWIREFFNEGADDKNFSRISLVLHFICKLLKPIGRAEMEREIQKTVKKISEDKEITKISGDESFEFDKNVLKTYLKQVITEIKKERE